MKYIFSIPILLLSFACAGRNLRTYVYGPRVLTGTVVLKTLKHPVTGKAIKNAMVLVLPEPVRFVPAPSDEEGDTVVTREIRIYGDVTKNISPNVTYRAAINKKVEINGNYVFAPSGNYPLLVNIIEAFSYKILAPPDSKSKR